MLYGLGVPRKEDEDELEGIVIGDDVVGSDMGEFVGMVGIVIGDDIIDMLVSCGVTYCNGSVALLIADCWPPRPLKVTLPRATAACPVGGKFRGAGTG